MTQRALTKQDAILAVLDHCKRHGNPREEDSLVGHNTGLGTSADPSCLNSAEEIALLQMGLDLKIYRVDELDAPARALLGKP